MKPQLLDILHRQPKSQRGQSAYVYLWQKDEHGSRTLWYEVGDPLPPYQENRHTYFSVHPCKTIPTTDASGRPAPQHKVRGRVADIASIGCLYAEFDLHTDDILAPPPAGLPAAVAAPGEDADEKSTLLALLSEVDPAPSCIVDSGGGYHVYWFLDHALPATSAAQQAQADFTEWLSDPQRSPTAPFTADPAAKDLARVLRLPSTFNYKYDPPRPVTIVQFYPGKDHRYPLAVLTAAAADPEPAPVHISFTGSTLLPSQPSIVSVADIETYVKHAVARELDRVRRSTEGNRNVNLNQAAFAIGRYIEAADLDTEFLAHRLLEAASIHFGTGSPPFTRREAATTIAKALVAGQESDNQIIFRTPEDVIEDFSSADSVQERIALQRELAAILAPAESTVQSAYLDMAKKAGMGGKTALSKSMHESRPSDADVRDAFLAAYPNFAYHPALEWMEYTQGYYRPVPESTVKRLIATTLDEADRSTLTASRVDSIAKLVYWEVCQPIEVWDSADLVVCENGSLVLGDNPASEAIKLRPHRRDDWSTHNVDYAYPDTPIAQLGQVCPNFLQAVTRLGPTLSQFLQEYVGYCLTSDTRHDIMVWLVGRPGCGKSTIVRGILTALGNHATMLSLRELNRSRFALNGIAGKTLIYGTDVGTDFADNTESLNSIVSGDPIRIEAKYSNPVEIRPAAKVLWAMTRMPQLRDPDDGLFRRVQVIHIPPLATSDMDPDLRLAVELEGPGILQWAIAGLKRLRARGRFNVPSEVREWTIQYRDDQDKTGHFVSECLALLPSPYVRPEMVPGTDIEAAPPAIASKDLDRASAVYGAYREWCKINGYNPLGKYKMYEDLRRLGVLVEKVGGGVKLLSHSLLPRAEWNPEAATFIVTTSEGMSVTGQL